MSREEATRIYFDTILEFRGAYGRFRYAAETLTDDKKEVLICAVTTKAVPE